MRPIGLLCLLEFACLYQPLVLGEEVEQAPERVLEVEAAFPDHGRSWNDYLRRNVSSDDLLDQSDLPCEGDEVGDENGLCESHEHCIFSPNFGAYQGEGDPYGGGSCVFANGVVYDVTMHAYPVNGA
jgi:hypothetical protein